MSYTRAEVLNLFYELKETQTRREDKRLDMAIKCLEQGGSVRLALDILNGQVLRGIDDTREGDTE